MNQLQRRDDGWRNTRGIKKTHYIIPVIASNDIPTLLPLVGPTTKEFGFVINSQSDKKSWYALENSVF